MYSTIGLAVTIAKNAAVYGDVAICSSNTSHPVVASVVPNGNLLNIESTVLNL